MNAAQCPHCNSRLPVSFVEGIRAPAVSRTLAFSCPNCGSRLIVDYWDVKANVFRVLFVLGAIVLAIAASWLNLGTAVLVPLFLAYIVVGWLVLLQLRRIVYADSRRNEEVKRVGQA
jgi:DNA-directed RNA polymerase subunit RPC12/RpoP